MPIQGVEAGFAAQTGQYCVANDFVLLYAVAQQGVASTTSPVIPLCPHYFKKENIP